MTTLLMACVAMAISAMTVGHLIMWDLPMGIVASCVASALVMHWLNRLRGYSMTDKSPERPPDRRYVNNPRRPQ